MVAEINVERKQPSIWPWIVGLIVLALLVWILVERFGADGGAEPSTPTETDTAAATAPFAPGPDVTPPPPTGVGGADAAGILPDTALP